MPAPSRATPAAPSSPRDNAFDLLRLVAATIVVVQHASAAFGTNFGWGIAGAFDGVAIFFVLSGMLVYASAHNIYERTGRWRQFYVNRYLRIAPALYAFTIVVPITFLAIGATGVGETLVPGDLAKWVGGNVLLVPGYEMPAWSDVGLGSVTWPLYTITAEVSFYVIAPVLVIAARRWGLWAMLGPFLVLGVAGAVVFQVLSPDGLGPTQPMLAKALSHTFVHRAFAFGVGIFWFAHWSKISFRWWLIALSAAVYAASVLATDDLMPSSVTTLVEVAAISYLVMVVGHGLPRAAVPKWIGDLSFGTYLYHYLVINVLLWFGQRGEWWNTPVVIAASWTTASVSWHLVERPALRRKRISLRGSGTGARATSMEPDPSRGVPTDAQDRGARSAALEP